MAGFWKRVGGALGRLVGRGEGREEAPRGEAPEAPPAAPAPPAEPPSGGEPPAAPPGQPELPEEGGEEGAEEEEEREYPSSVEVSIAGHWVVSTSRWNGVIGGTLTGQDARAFIDAMEDGNEEAAVELVAAAYDDMNMGFADHLKVDQSSWASIDY